MHPNPRRIIPVIFLVLIILAAWWYLQTEKAAAETKGLQASGTVEATQVRIGPEIGGRVLRIHVAEGDTVKAGDVLVELDTTLLQAQREQAAATVKSAQSNLDLLKAGATDEQLSAAEAQLAQADANYKAAKASLAVLTDNARPEEVTAAWTNLEHLRTEYYSLTVVLDANQVEKVHATLTLAEGNLAKAESRRGELEKDARNPASSIAAAESAVAEARQALDAAQQAYQAANNPTSPFYLQIQKTRQALELAKANLDQAKARRDALKKDENMPTAALDAAETTVTEAQDLSDTAQEAYDALTSDPWAPWLEATWREVQDAQDKLNGFSRGIASGPAASVETALNQVNVAAAAKDAASANLEGLRRGPRAEQIDAAQAQVEAVQANLNALEAQLSKMTLVSPVEGVVLSRSIEPGEVATPGSSLLVIGQLDELTITVYIPEDLYGTLSLGETAQVNVDSFPGETFPAKITHIADEAEFTPRNVQTTEGRRTTVFAVKLAISNRDGKLKPGMPADVKFGS